jgi:methionyl-tRNA synthetase
MRFYLAYTRPEVESTSFTLADFEATCDRELGGTWQSWLSSLGEKLRRDFGGKVPATGDWTEEHRRFYHRLETLSAEAAEAYEARTFSPQRASRVLCEVVREARRFGKSEESWRRVPVRAEERRTGAALELLAAKVLAVLASPIMPKFAVQLWQGLGYETPLTDQRWEETPAWVPAGQQIGNLGETYFQSVHDALAARRQREA